MEFSFLKYFILALIIIVVLFISERLYRSLMKSRANIKIPKHFYMRVEHLSKSISALRKISLTHKKNIIVDFSNVEGITQGSYMVFLAQVEKVLLKGKRIYFYRNLPTSKAVINIMFGKKTYKHENINIDTEKLSDKGQSYNKLDPNYIDEVVSELKKLGFTEYYKPFYDYLVELIGNATEHGICHRNINWWMLRYRDYNSKSIKYVFVDMGTGIIKSYIESRIPLKYWFKGKENIILDALNGKLGSSTKKSNRGRGLPQIREIIEKGCISDFILITNGVSLRYINNKFIISKNPNFVGTYYSWTINKENFLKWKSSQ